MDKTYDVLAVNSQSTTRTTSTGKNKIKNGLVV